MTTPASQPARAKAASPALSAGIYRVLFERSPDAISLLDPRTGRLIECSPAMKSMLGYAPDEAGPASVGEVCALASPEESIAHVEAALRTGHHEFYSKWRRRDGRVIDVEVRAGTLNADGATLVYAIAHDVTARLQAQESLRREQRLFLGGPAVVFRWRAAEGWPVEYVSANVAQFGYTVEAFVSGRLRYASLLHPDDLERVAREVREHTESGEASFSQEYRLRRGDGAYMHLLDRTVVVRDEAGRATHYEGYVVDDTQRRLAERFLSLLVRRSPIGIIVWNTDMRVRDWNPAAAAIFGHSSDQARGQPFELIVPAHVRPHVRAVVDQLLAATGGERSRNENVTRDGRTILCDWYNTPLIDDDGKVIGIASMVEDVTDEVRAQRDLAQRERDLRMITDAIPAVIGSIGADGRYRFVNKAYQDWVGLPMDRIIGRTRAELVGQVFEKSIADKVAAVLSGQLVRFENRVMMNGTLRDTDVMFIPHVDEGVVQGYYVLAVDVTERKAAERELAQHRDHLESLVAQRTAELEAQSERLRQASQLASLGTLAAGLGHDMNNMLLPMRCAVDAMEVEADSDGRHAHVASLRRSLEFLGQLASSLLALASAPDDAARGPIRTSLAAWWARDGAMLAAASRGVPLRIDLPARLPDAAIAPEQLTRAVLNLIVNAAEAYGAERPPDAEIRVWARPELIDGKDMLTLAVSDNGPGMPDDVQRRAPEPFFTTKKRGFSTGLGLSLVHATVKAAGGTMRLYSPQGQGTTVMLNIPVAASTDRGGPAQSRGSGVRTACVTVADDRLAGYILALLGARNYSAVRGDPASGPGEAAVWITEPAFLGSHMGSGASRKTIVVGEPPPELPLPGAILIQDPTDVAAISAALR